MYQVNLVKFTNNKRSADDIMVTNFSKILPLPVLLVFTVNGSSFLCSPDLSLSAGLSGKLKFWLWGTSRMKVKPVQPVQEI